MTRRLPALKLVACGLLAAATLSTPAPAQVCPDPGDVHYQNDTLPQVPSGFEAIAIVPGLCEGEAAGAVFDLQGPGPQQLTLVACPFASQFGSGTAATVNLVVYDNVTFSGGVPNMSNEVFNLNNDTGLSLQITDGGINTFDVSSYNIQVSGPKFVVAFFMNINPNGSCSSIFGYPTNFFTDNSNNPPCPTQKNLIFIQGQGWRDSATATVLGTPLCGLFYKGNWVIRACARPVTNPINVTVIGSPAQPGGFVNLIFNAPGRAGELYVAAAAASINTGIPLPPHGVFPLDYDPLLEYVVLGGGGGVFQNFVGFMGPAGTAPGLVLLPPTVAPGTNFYVAFVVFDPLDPAAAWGISSPSLVQVQ